MWYLVSAHNFLKRGNDFRVNWPRTFGAAAASSTAALVTATARSNPMVSTEI